MKTDTAVKWVNGKGEVLKVECRPDSTGRPRPTESDRRRLIEAVSELWDHQTRADMEGAEQDLHAAAGGQL